MTDELYIAIWRELRSGTLPYPNPANKDVIEVYRKDFQGTQPTKEDFLQMKIIWTGMN